MVVHFRWGFEKGIYLRPIIFHFFCIRTGSLLLRFNVAQLALLEGVNLLPRCWGFPFFSSLSIFSHIFSRYRFLSGFYGVHFCNNFPKFIVEHT